mmetsp:Transcript_71264/g.118434  ORF Transcript_71264/g.118434 Transcript_71264/m.118434 type:complete len:391 (+) Transcript_71264:118-1290(+)|eukprot:CAMPEP_0119318602 /NCGR_PEP_ID=MMETSP1333-20130426/46940_1 /TAXON_ID=418940 /ORGANISM="Scyphosphaera apsteinii, Strain RCC1455" /LENGTH=390 /DNA_ID=CAMNT_0007324821 /DNA_START=106 /DNA_END=1278 /DNA_ORIENTATION=+
MIIIMQNCCAHKRARAYGNISSQTIKPAIQFDALNSTIEQFPPSEFTSSKRHAVQVPCRASTATSHAVSRKVLRFGAVQQLPFPKCECFSLCGNGAVFDFLQRLPVVQTTSSPWYGYLQRVYRSTLPLPFDLKKLELFYPALLPTSRYGSHKSGCAGKNASIPACPASECTQWLSEFIPLQKGPRSVIWMSGIDDPKETSPFATFFIVQPPRFDRRLIQSHRWVEVMRRALTNRFEWDGGDYGCWFWPAKGSGVWLNVGDTLGYSSRKSALLAAHLSASKNRSLAHLPLNDDSGLSRYTISQGKLTLQILWGVGNMMGGSPITNPASELIVSQGCCGNPATNRSVRRPLSSACPPKEVGLRAGWNATLSCFCDTKLPVLNCQGNESSAVE